MLSHSYPDPYTTDPATGKPAVKTRYGIGIATGRREYGRTPGGQAIVDDEGADGVDTVTAVMFDTGEATTFDVTQVEKVENT